ncbi:MAG TPA: hypothetical protein PLH72_19130 [Vicinamibacterales bacterium]|nr:hypothetical protein [Vicinamibacterales bacterium]
MDLTQRVCSRTARALVMVVVATMGAAIAYWTAGAEQATARLNRQLTLGRMVEVSTRQQIAGDWSVRRLLDSMGAEQPPRRAGAAGDVAAQQKSLIDGLIATLSAGLRYGEPTGDLRADIGAAIVRELDAAGYPAPRELTARTQREGDTERALTFDNVVGDRMLPNWGPMDEQIELLHERVLSLAFSVTIIVVALAFLTLSDLSRSASVSNVQ